MRHPLDRRRRGPRCLPHGNYPLPINGLETADVRLCARTASDDGEGESSDSRTSPRAGRFTQLVIVEVLGHLGDLLIGR